MSLPSRGDAFRLLMHHLGEAQNAAATIAHLHSLNIDVLVAGAADKERIQALGWMTVSEALKLMQKNVTRMAQGRGQ